MEHRPEGTRESAFDTCHITLNAGHHLLKSRVQPEQIAPSVKSGNSGGRDFSIKHVGNVDKVA